MKARRLNKGIFWLIGLALLLALVLPSDGTGVVQASPLTVTLRPNADVTGEFNLSIGGTSPAATNWESVDEFSSDGDATYVEGDGGTYATDLYNLDNTSLSGAIRSVTIYVNCKGTKEGVGAYTWIKTNGVADDGTPETLTTSYADYSTVYTTNPQSGNPWTWDEINALQAGVGLKKPAGGAASRCTQVWVVIEYFSTTIEIRAQDYSTAVAAITFPEAAPGSEVSQPYNDVNGTGSPQGFGGAGVAKPVVTLFNGGASTLTIWYNITTFTNGIVSSEYYLINAKGAACESAGAINNAVTFDADTTTGTTIAASAEKDLYLKIALSDVAGKSGTSTITILGEST